MSELFEDPPRWRDHADQANLTERAFGQVLRAIKTPAPLTGSQMARLAAGMRPPRARRPRVWFAVAISFVLGLATAASAARMNMLPRWLTGAATPKPPAATPVPRAHGSGRTSRPSSTVALPARPVAEPEPETTAPVRPAVEARPATANPGEPPARAAAITTPHRPGALVKPAPTVPRADERSPLAPSPAANGGMVPPPMPSASPTPTDTSRARAAHLAMLGQPAPTAPGHSQAVESGSPTPGDADAAKILVDAIRILRVDGSPESALALLDRHDTLFGKSHYSHEALLVRVDALLALKRDGELLRLLDRTALTDVAASRTLLLTRGRLRASANRCAEAVRDFDRVLAEPGRADLQALQGRAMCREKLGDAAGARADWERYRRKSPRSQ